MNARLGFAIAAHLEPDILTIDEVLSVGDASFQQKDFTRIKQMATGGAPVVLVSHQLDRIAELCTKAILLDKGMVRTTGTPVHCINTYLNSLTDDSHTAELDTVIRYERGRQRSCGSRECTVELESRFARCGIREPF
jgi:ABC-type polysaccharide/polyol phosphate transport system ATPase subunit